MDFGDYSILSQMNRLRYITIIDDKEVELTNIFEVPNLSELRVLNSEFLSTNDLLKINKNILLEISGTTGIEKDTLDAMKVKFNVVDDGTFVIKEGDFFAIS